MEQTNSLAANMLQTIVSQTTGIPKTTGKADSDQTSDFQKLLDEKAQEKDPLVEEPAKSPAKSETTPAKKTEKAPAQAKKQESTLEQIKKLAEQGYAIIQPTLPGVTLDGQVYQPGEYVQVWTENGIEFIPITDLNEAELYQLQQIVAAQNLDRAIDVVDPEVDALLKATAPGAKFNPAEVLEEAMSDELGQVTQQVMEEVQPKMEAEVQTQADPQSQNLEQDDDSQVEVIDVEQAPQRIFHDVEAAPVKVGETELTQQTDEADVVRQVETRIAQAVQQGESTVTVRINPENLGEVTVQVSMKSDGVMAVAISARNDDTRTLLERHTADLQNLLASRVREPVEVSVQRQQESQQNQNQQQNYDGRNGHAQDGQRERRQQREHTSSQDFMQQLRLGLIPMDGEL